MSGTDASGNAGGANTLTPQEEEALARAIALELHHSLGHHEHQSRRGSWCRRHVEWYDKLEPHEKVSFWIWMLLNIGACVHSIVCAAGKNRHGSVAAKAMGVITALLFGPLYWIYFAGAKLANAQFCEQE